jgi:hypothetical protein
VTDEPNPAAVMANREALLQNLGNILLSPNKVGEDDIATLQARYTVALVHVANFLKASGADEDIVRKFLELADAIGQLKHGAVADVLRGAAS